MFKDTKFFNFLSILLILVTIFTIEIRRSVAKDDGVTLHDDLLFHPGPDSEVLDQALEKAYPTWSSFRQQPDWYDEPVSAGQIIKDASYEETFHLNSAVLLVTVGLELEWQLPNDGDLYSRGRDTGEQLSDFVHEWVHPESEHIRSQYPEVSNGATLCIVCFL